jgi:DNA topoisomerase-1
VKHGKINATIPKEVDPQDMTLERAVELIAARAAKAKTAPAKKKAVKKPAKKKTAAKKKAAKKPAAKKADTAPSAD